MRFEGKVVVVTGAGHGIGRATARRFAGEGAHVVVVDMNESGAAETVDLITAEGGTAQAMVADVSDERAVADLGARIATAHGRVDVLHNNAGRLRGGSVTDLSVDEWDLTFAVNVRSMFLVSRAADPAHASERRRDREHGVDVGARGRDGDPGVQLVQGRCRQPDAAARRRLHAARASA